MKFSNKFQIGWWVLVLLLLAAYVALRFAPIIAGDTNTLDLALLVLFVAVLLVPIFSEIAFAGFSVKQQLDAAKTEILGAVHNISNKLKQETVINQHFQAPPDDSKLPKLEELTQAAVAVAADEQGVAASPLEASEDPAFDQPDPLFLATVKKKLEDALLNLAWKRLPGGFAGNMFQVIGELGAVGAIPPELVTPVRVIFSICLAEEQGKNLTDSQIAFVRDNQKAVIRTLRSL